MNIYDEALLEIAKDFGLDDDDIIVKALERAKKVEELSTLKSELILAYHTLNLNTWGEVTLTNLEHACWCKTRDDLIEQIKIKEKELEEMK